METATFNEWTAPASTVDLDQLFSAAVDPGPAEDIEAWAESAIVLSDRVTMFAGPLRLDRSPYLRVTLRAWECGLYRELWNVWGAQIGKTLCSQIILGWIVDKTPGPTMVVYPSQSVARKRSRKHLQTMLKESPRLSRHITSAADDLTNFEFSLDRLVVNIGWSGSASELAAESIKFGIGDEVAKWIQRDKDEAHPLALFRRRLIAFEGLARSLFVTTPKTRNNPGWGELERSTFHEYFVPCPHCGKPDRLADVPLLVIDPADHTKRKRPLHERLRSAGYQVLTWEQFTGWGKERDPDKAAALTFVRCGICNGEILDRHKPAMVASDVAKAVPRNPGRRVFGFHLPSWYSLRVPFGDVVRRFYEAVGDPTLLQDWVNADKVEVWEDLGKAATADEILIHGMVGRDTAYAPDTIPFDPLVVLMTADIGQNEIWYVVRAWGEFERSALVRWGCVPRFGDSKVGDRPDGRTLRALKPIMEKDWPAPSGNVALTFTFIDEGFDMDEVRAFCRHHVNCEPIKGSDEMQSLVRYSKPDKVAGTTRPRRDSVKLSVVSSDAMKDRLTLKQSIPLDEPGAWWCHREISMDPYAKHLSAERKVERKNNRGQLVYQWRRFGANHLFDCEYYQAAGAYILGVRDMKRKPDATETQEPRPAQPAAAGKGYVTRGKPYRVK